MEALVVWVLTMALAVALVPEELVVPGLAKRVQIMAPILRQTYRRDTIPTTARRSQYPRT